MNPLSGRKKLRSEDMYEAIIGNRIQTSDVELFLNGACKRWKEVGRRGKMLGNHRKYIETSDVGHFAMEPISGGKKLGAEEIC